MNPLINILANLEPVKEPYAPWETLDTAVLPPDFLLNRGIPHSILHDLYSERILLGRESHLVRNPPGYIFDKAALEEKLSISQKLAKLLDKREAAYER